MEVNKNDRFVEKKPFLSICIPAYGRLSITKKTIESIYSDIEGVDLNDFEVILSDNDPNMELKSLQKKFNFSNFHYKLSNEIGFMNSLAAMSFANGHFIKLHNNTMMFKKRALYELVNFAKINFKKKPSIFYTNGSLRKYSNSYYKNFDQYMQDLSYFSSWSNGFSIWNSNFNYKKDDIDEYFPHVSLLFSHSDNNSFIICDNELFKMQSVKNKGGYNIFKIFCRNFLGLLKEGVINKKIGPKTLKIIKKDMLFKFLPLNFFKTKIIKVEKYSSLGIKNSIDQEYPWYGYYVVVICGSLFFFYYMFDVSYKFLIKIFSFSDTKKNR